MSFNSRTSGYPVFKQGELDYACGLHAVYSIARHLGRLSADDGLARLVGAREEALNHMPRTARGVAPFVWGIGFNAMRELATKVGLNPLDVPRGDLQRLKEGLPALVFVWSTFNDPRSRHPSYSGDHFLAVFEAMPEGLVFGDPHA